VRLKQRVAPNCLTGAVARRHVSLSESLKTTFEHAHGSTSNPVTDATLCLFLGIWWWITGIPGSETSSNAAPDVATAERLAARATAKDGWYQLDGRWYCEAHDAPFCKRCSSLR